MARIKLARETNLHELKEKKSRTKICMMTGKEEEENSRMERKEPSLLYTQQTTD
jgi:hypothetical protein